MKSKKSMQKTKISLTKKRKHFLEGVFSGFKSFMKSHMMCCAILDQMPKNGIQMVSQNAVLTSYNAFEWITQESVFLNPISCYSNSYLTFNHLRGMYIALERHENA